MIDVYFTLKTVGLIVGVIAFVAIAIVELVKK